MMTKYTQEKLKKILPNFEIFVEKTLISTNPFAKEKLNDFEKVAVLARVQKGGRGRNGRSFVSKKGGVYLTIAYRCDLDKSFSTKSSLLAGVAAARALHNQGIEIGLKWPNDLIFSNKKLGGIICECKLENERVKSIVVGIGLNVSNKISKEIKDIAITVSSITKEFDENLYIKDFVTNLYDMTVNMKYDLNEYKFFSNTLGKEISVQCEREYRGTCVGIDEDGYLIIDEDGKYYRISYGDVTVLEED